MTHKDSTITRLKHQKGVLCWRFWRKLLETKTEWDKDEFIRKVRHVVTEKIPFTLLLEFQPPSGPVLKTGW